MRTFIRVLIMTALISASFAQTFDKFFEDQTMRVDYHHTGDKKYELVTIDRVYQYGIWAGSRKNLIDNFNNGKYYVKIYDLESKSLIYSKGFDSYFGEYQYSGPAAEGIKKTYHETALFPAPKNKIRFVIEKRDDKQVLNEIFSAVIDPADVNIVKDSFADDNVVVYKSHTSGDPHAKVDLAIIGEGYTANETQKFKDDIDRFTKIFFNNEPYSQLKDKFNIYGVLKPSNDTGVDEPRAAIFKNTSVNCTFNSMGSERYLLTEDNKALRDIAASVPYDAVAIMVNHKRYGGGGIYNFFATFTSDNQFCEYLLIHEFGHSFAGLADEYYTSATAYDTFFKVDQEPLEPNITALLDKDNLKWKDLVDEGLALPTPWEKEEFDKADYAWQKERRELNNKIARLKREKAPKADIEAAELEYATKDKARSDRVDAYLAKCEHFGKVGAFEGAGYLPKGMYRSMLDCIMFSKGEKPFCEVCQAAIEKVVMHYTE